MLGEERRRMRNALLFCIMCWCTIDGKLKGVSPVWRPACTWVSADSFAWIRGTSHDVSVWFFCLEESQCKDQHGAIQHFFPVCIKGPLSVPAAADVLASQLVVWFVLTSRCEYFRLAFLDVVGAIDWPCLCERVK